MRNCKTRQRRMLLGAPSLARPANNWDRRATCPKGILRSVPMPHSQAENSPVKILVVEDHPAVREALAARIAQNADLQICGEAEDETEALRLVAELNPDIIITDITLKKGDGID